MELVSSVLSPRSRIKGSDLPDEGRFLFSIDGGGHLTRTDLERQRTVRMDTGLGALEDVLVDRRGRQLFLTTVTGDVYGVALAGSTPGQLRCLASGLTQPQLVEWEEATGRLYLLECGPQGRLLALDVLTGDQAEVVRGLSHAMAIQIDLGEQVLYVLEGKAPSTRLMRIDLLSGVRRPFAPARFVSLVTAPECCNTAF